MEKLTTENLRKNFEKVISDLNKLNEFCKENNISYGIVNHTDYHNQIYCGSGVI